MVESVDIKSILGDYRVKYEKEYELNKISEETYKTICSFIDDLSSSILKEDNQNFTNEEIYEFEFEASNDPRKGIPYVARVFWDNDKNSMERSFFDLARDYGRKSVTVWGTYEAKESDIIEIREGGSWKNDYRYFYIVREGKLTRLGDATSDATKVLIKKYLKGAIPLEDLISE